MERGKLPNNRMNGKNPSLTNLLYDLKDKIELNQLAVEFLKNNDLHNLFDSKRATLLHCSILNRDKLMTRWLLDHGFDVNAQTADGETPLMIAERRNRGESVIDLLDFNADIDIEDNQGYTVLERSSIITLVKPSVIEMIMKKLIDKCQTIEEVIVKLLNSRCPLYVAILARNIEITRFLLDRGVDVNMRHPQKGITALHVAASIQDGKNMELLLSYGADINAEDSFGKTPIAYACPEYYEPSEKMVALTILLDRGAKLTSCTKYGFMQISKVLHNCRKEAVRRVIQSNIELKAKDEFGDTVIHCLASNRHPGVLEVLRDRAIDVKAVNQQGHTPLHSATIASNSSNVQYLLSRGADVNSEAESQWTPLYHIFYRDQQCNEDILCAEFLLEYGANFQMVKYEGLVLLNKYASDMVELVLAHLVILEMRGTDIDKNAYEMINKNEQLKRPYDTLKLQIENSKKIIIHDSLTMFEMLTTSEHKLLVYLRNKKLTLKFDRIQYKNMKNMCFRRILERRITRIYRRMQLSNNATVTLCKIMRISVDSYPTVTEKICGYLNEYDLNQLVFF